MSTSAAVASVGGASYVSLGIGLLRGLLSTRALVPAARGTVHLTFLIAGYLSYGAIGACFGLEKRVPILIGQGDREQLKRLEGVGVTAVHILAGFGAVAMWVYAWLAQGLESTTRMAIVFGGFYIILSQICSVYRGLLRSHVRFGIIVRSTLLEAAVLFVLVVAGAHLLGAVGAMVGWCLGLAAVCLYLLFSGKPASLGRLHWPTTASLVRVGLPLLGAGLTGMFARTADNIVVAKYLGLEALGYYSLAWQLALYLYNVPGAADTVLTPKLFQAHGRGGVQAMKPVALDATWAFGALTPVLSVIAAIAAPVLVYIVLPQYVPAIPALKVFMFTVVLVAIPLVIRTVMVALNREFELMAWDAVGGLLIAGSVWFLIQRDPSVPLAHIAVAGGCGLCLRALIIVSRGLALLGLSAAEIVLYMVKLLVPLAYCVAAYWAAGWLTARVLGISSPIWAPLVALVIVAIAVLPLLWWVERKVAALSKLRDAWMDRGRRGQETADK